MSTPLPAPIVAQLASPGTALSAWAAAHREASLAEHEVGVRAAVQAALVGLLDVVVGLATADLAPSLATGEAIVVAPTPARLVVETDGAMARYHDGWHEVKLGVVGGVHDGQLTAASYIAARESADAFGPRLLAEAARRGARALGGTETTAQQWAEARLRDLRTVGVAPVRTALAAAVGSTVDAAETVRLARGYFATNAGRMHYPAIAAQGLPIGSGAAESSAQHVVQQRTKRPGQRWSLRGARAMPTPRARHAPDRPLACSPPGPVLR